MSNANRHIIMENSAAEVNAEQKVALVIGNGAYAEARLRNPVNDAADTAAVLQSLDFQVQLLRDANRRTMEEEVREFGRKLVRSGVGLFYFAGHGLQIHGRNYIIPIGANIQKEQDVEFESVDVGRILGEMDHAQSQLNVFILDACRNNPFARSFRSPTRGLAQMNAPNETLIAYATSPGEVANDGRGENSPYTEALLQVFPVPGLDILDIFRRTAAIVKKNTAGRQRPWIASDVTQQFYFIPVAAKESASPLLSTPSEKEKPPVVHEEKPAVETEMKRKFNVVLRSAPLDKLTEDQVKTMLDKRRFFTKEYDRNKPFSNAKGTGLPHQYRLITRHGQQLVVDATTGLTWQQSGSATDKKYADGERYIQNLNKEKFASYDDWRTPTFEEAMSLMEREKKNELYITPIFDKMQRWIWTADKKSADIAWSVNFRSGYCGRSSVELDRRYVRAVRSRQS